jgi:signal transduction histidine kinase
MLVMELNLEVENRQLKEEVRFLREQLQSLETERLKTAFLVNFSHEVRTPLSGIIGLLEVLHQNETFSDDVREVIYLINNNCEHLLTLMNDILDDAKIEAGQLTIHPKPVNINKMMIEVRVFFENLMQNSNKENVHLETFFDETVGDGMIIVDPVRLKQILYNLLSNAVKFTHEGYVHFGYGLADNETLEFWVKDTGVGIPSEQVSKMFERFRQAEQDENKKGYGCGLGLTISKKLALLMGGDIYATSTKDKGSTFYFTIPYVPQ